MTPHLTLLVLSTLAKAVSASPQLSLSFSGPSVVNDIHKLHLVTSVTNIGNEKVKLLAHPRSVLSKAPTNMFNITNFQGDSPQFIGIEVNFVIDLSLPQSDRGSEVTVLLPGQTVEREHALGLAYDFSASGPGPYMISLKDPTPFYYIVGGRIAQATPVHGVSFHNVNITGTSLRPRTGDGVHGDVCTDSKRREIMDAVPRAQEYATTALYELQKKWSRDRGGSIYTRWFGAPDRGRAEIVEDAFRRIVANDFAGYRFFCGGRNCDRTWLAYVIPDDFGNVTLCDQFFTVKNSGYPSRAATLVHEASHFSRNGGTIDDGDASTWKQAMELAKTDPGRAVKSAKNYEMFAVQASGDNYKDVDLEDMSLAPAQIPLVSIF